MHQLKKKILKIHFVVSLLCKLISLCYFSENGSSITCVEIYLLTECSRIIGIVGLRENINIFWIRLHSWYTETLLTVPKFRLSMAQAELSTVSFFEHKISISWRENFGVFRSPLQFWVQNFAFCRVSEFPFLSAKFSKHREFLSSQVQNSISWVQKFHVLST